MNIALIGFMASGKTSLGRLLAARMGRHFIDLDEYLCAQAGLSVLEIFEREGEAAFRRRESRALALLAAMPDKNPCSLLGAACSGFVLACGGGVVLDPENRLLLKEKFDTVWLSVDIETAVRRATAQGNTRPLLSAADPLVAAKKLFAQREDYYRDCARFEFNTEGQEPAAAASLLYQKITALQ